MSYGLRVWDRLGQLGTDSSDVVGLGLFAANIAPSASLVITDVDARPRLVLMNLAGRLIDATLTVGAVVYDGSARTLTVTNNISPSTQLFFAIQW